MSGQLCCVDECSICKNNNKFGIITSPYLIIDLTKSKLTKAIIGLSKSKFTKEIKNSSIIMGDLNFLCWVVLKLDKSMTNDLYEPLAKKLWYKKYRILEKVR